jgi:hypothetical protein
MPQFSKTFLFQWLIKKLRGYCPIVQIQPGLKEVIITIKTEEQHIPTALQGGPACNKKEGKRLLKFPVRPTKNQR